MTEGLGLLESECRQVDQLHPEVVPGYLPLVSAVHHDGMSAGCEAPADLLDSSFEPSIPRRHASGPDHCDASDSLHAQYPTMPRIDLGPEKTDPGTVPQCGLDRSVVAAFLATLQAAGSSVCLLHTGGDADSRHWQGDVDLLVTSDRAAFLRAMDTAAASLGFSAVLQVPRLFNTIEIDLLFPGSTSWTVVFVDRHGVVLHVDAAFAPSPAIPEIDEETGLTYVILKRLRKRDLDPEAWARIAERARRRAPALEPYLGDRLARCVTDAAVHGEVPDPAVVDEADRALRARRNRTPRAIRALARAVRVAARRSFRPAGAFVSLGGVDGSGKSAVTDALMDWSPFRQARRLHARPGLLKPMG